MRRIGISVGLVVAGRISGALSDILSPLKASAAGTRTKVIGRLLGNASHLKLNQSLAYTDPKSGDPAVLIRLSSGRLLSYDALCTHAGCTVPYDPARKLLVCPCHGARFDPAQSGKVVGGPAPQPLTQLSIRVDASGNVYALDAKPAAGPVKGGLYQPPSTGSGGEADGADDNSDGQRRRPKGGGHT
ncbi:MAG TPA: Rieske 2Fe-2S domain-containing protein [Chloroflexota bacterium]